MKTDPTKFEDWDLVWKARAASYNLANEVYPDARKAERDTFIAGLSLAPGLRVLEVGAAGGYLSSGIHAALGGNVTILAIESSDAHVGALPPFVQRVDASAITSFALADEAVDRVVNLASLHHTIDDGGFFAESWRVLRRGGWLGAADVLAGSPVATWLNEFVHEHNSRGHVGRFYHRGELATRLEAAGFVEIRERVCKYTWDFRTVEGMCEYSRLLFGLDRPSPREIETAIREILGVVDLPDGGVGFHWGLLHGFGRKA